MGLPIGISEDQFNALMVLHKKLKKFTREYGVYHPDKSTENLVRTSEWEEIRGLAKNVLAAFHRLPSDK